MKSLASQLLGDTRAAILAVLLLRPDEPQHVRELARLTGVSPGTLHRDLTALESLGVLRRNAVGRQVYFTANRACPVFAELAGLLRKTAGRAKAQRAARARGADLAAKDFKSPRGGGNAATTTQAAVAAPTLHSPVASYVATTAAKGTTPVLQKLRVSQVKLEALCRKYGIAKLSLFGSASRGELTPESDVDLMVEFLPDSRASLFDITAMQDEFSAALGGRKADIATPEILRNPFRRDAIVPDLKLIYEA
jgi:predicted nucleotidyltransferase/DNA-binding transcriptional ArsR family regulator